MNLNIDIPDNIAAALKAKAQAQDVSADRFIIDVLEKTLAPDLAQVDTKPLKTGRGTVQYKDLMASEASGPVPEVDPYEPF